MYDSNLCVICGYSITDPVCSNCYINQTMILLNDLKVNPIASDFIQDDLKNKFYLETLNDVECILCKKNIVNLCRYCFSTILVRILRELNFTEEIIESFEYNQMYEENSLENEKIIGIEMEVK